MCRPPPDAKALPADPGAPGADQALVDEGVPGVGHVVHVAVVGHHPAAGGRQPCRQPEVGEGTLAPRQREERRRGREGARGESENEEKRGSSRVCMGGRSGRHLGRRVSGRVWARVSGRAR